MPPAASVLRVAVSGARGRVGREIVAGLEAEPGFDCVAVLDVGDDIAVELGGARPDALVDFSVPAAAVDNALAAVAAGASPVVGTTGTGEAGTERIRAACAAARRGGCVIPNFAVGAVLMAWLGELAAPHFERCEIIEAHHAGKLDAPSGTALRTAERLLAARGGTPFEHARPATETLAGTRGGELGGAGIHSLRLDGVVADQSVTFGAAGQTLSIDHRTTSRAAFLPGVLLAVRHVVTTSQFCDSLDPILGLPPAATVYELLRSSGP